jgi:hypothetical protein
MDDRDRVVAFIRTNIVFETMIVSILTIAWLAFAAHLLIGLGRLAVEGALSAAAVGRALFEAVIFSVLFFLSGFAAAVAVGIPLYRWLDRLKVRKTWPYSLAALVVGAAILSAVGAAPTPGAPANLLYLAPGLAASILFGRKMRPFWRSAERSDAIRLEPPLQ